DGTQYNVDIYPIEKIFRGVTLPAAKGKVTFAYVPRMFCIGATISFFGVIFAATLFCVYTRKRHLA
ncbi:MAG: hypothetical protein ACRC2T_12410, partial [Thermoguttaceae bacterium]